MRTQKSFQDIAREALLEAEQRRQKHDLSEKNKKADKEEINGRKGLEPTRFGDWENKGIISDF